MAKWKKLGNIFDPILLKDHGLSHALMPIVECIDSENDIIRVYFSPRNELSVSQLNYFDFDIKPPMRILNIVYEPIFQAGKIGSFDDCGVTPGCLTAVNNKRAYFFTGWSLTKTVPMNNSIGLAFFNDKKGLFERVWDGPIMTRTRFEPFSCASPFVLYDEGKYKMWYASMDNWKEDEKGVVKHFYNIKYATSDDGIDWHRQNIVAINYENQNEYAFGRPFVLKEDGLYKMWYAFRGNCYEIGYAESEDGIKWIRNDDTVGIFPSQSGWDSEMIEYPFIFDYKGERYMFYNGNGYGKSGIGMAILVQ